MVTICFFKPQINPMFTSAYGDRADAQNIALILTDGNSNINAPDTIPSAIAARAQGIYMIVFGVGTDMNMVELSGIASDPTNSTIFLVQSYVNLKDILSPIVYATANSTYAFFI